VNFWAQPRPVETLRLVPSGGRREVIRRRNTGAESRVDLPEDAKSLSRPQLLMLLACARAHRERDWLLLLVCFWHGLRVSELVAFGKDAVADGYLTIRRPDGSARTRHMLVEHPEPLLDEKDALGEFAEQAEVGLPVFNVCRRRVDQLMKRYCAEVGIPAHLAHAQTLRHTVARLSIESGGIEYARRWLGYKSRTSIYECLKGTEEEAEGAAGRESEKQATAALPF
jgi:integrase